MADALPESTLAALDDPFAQLSGPLASTTRLDLQVVEPARLTPHMQRLSLTAPQLLAAPARPSRGRPGSARGRGGRGRAAARPRPRLPVRRGDGRVPAAGDPRRARARPGPDVAQGVLGPRPGQRQSRRARPGYLADPAINAYHANPPRSAVSSRQPAASPRSIP